MTQSRKKVVAEVGGKGVAVASGGGLTSAMTVASSVEVMVRGGWRGFIDCGCRGGRGGGTGPAAAE
jgi:hypothetical protein